MRDEFEDGQYVAEEDSRQGWRGRFTERVSTWIGAVLALLVIGGLMFWGYRLGQRDATAVPVLRAALEPAKVQPDDPGGAEIPYQDITSYSAGDAGNAPTAITFAPPPERPAKEDVAMGALPDGEAAVAGAATDDAAGGAGASPGDGSGQAPQASPVAPVRPGDLSQRMAAARRAISEEDALASRAAASRVQIQLGAYSGRELTRSEWARIYSANEDILTGRALVVQSTISGGRRFFRLRAGPFKDRIEAQNVCRALQARGQECLVAVNL